MYSCTAQGVFPRGACVGREVKDGTSLSLKRVLACTAFLSQEHSRSCSNTQTLSPAREALHGVFGGLTITCSLLDDQHPFQTSQPSLLLILRDPQFILKGTASCDLLTEGVYGSSNLRYTRNG